MSSQTYLITGANRGIGKVLLSTYLLRPNHTVIAAVRDVASTEKALASVPIGKDSKLIVVKIDSASETDPFEAAAELTSKYGITKIDVVISNAGTMPTEAILPALKTPAKFVREISEVNTVGPLLLIQAFFGLLSASPKPRFFVISSAIGSIASLGEYNVPFFAYGLSKAAVNYLVVKLHHENEGLISVAYSPGWLKTDMGNGAAEVVGMAEAPVAVEEGVAGLVKQFDVVSREASGGRFFNYTGEEIAW